MKKRIEFIKKEDSYFNWSESGNGKKVVRTTVPLTIYNKSGINVIEGGYFEKVTQKRCGTVLGEKGRGYWREN